VQPTPNDSSSVDPVSTLVGAVAEMVAPSKSSDEDADEPAKESDIDSKHLRTIKIRYEQIVIDKEFNSRKDYKEILVLAEDIGENGLISPPVVWQDEKSPEVYHLMVGFRRTMAIGRLREQAAEAGASLPFEEMDVKLYEGPEINRWFMNLAENIGRVDLHVWEIGDQCIRIRDRFQMSGSQIGEKLKYQKSHVNNCMRVVERIASDVQEQFRTGRANPPFSLLLQLAGLVTLEGKPDHDKQRIKWNEWVNGGPKKAGGVDGGEGEGEGDDDSDEEPSGRMVRLREAERVLSKLEEGLKEATGVGEKEYFRGGIAAAKYLMGLTSKIKKVSLASGEKPAKGSKGTKK
jgi:ParB/RepB/Spo0J family partition protein